MLIQVENISASCVIPIIYQVQEIQILKESLYKKIDYANEKNNGMYFQFIMVIYIMLLDKIQYKKF